MIETKPEGIEFICDGIGCGETEIIPVRDFKKAVVEAKNNGWGIVKVEEGWEHYCPKCQAGK